MKTKHLKQICTRWIRLGTTICTFTFVSVLGTAGSLPMAIAQSFPPSSFSAYPPPTVFPIDGIWKLQWRTNGNSFDALLTVTGNSGTMTVNVRYSNGQSDVVQERIGLQANGNQIILSGQNAVYAGTNMPIASYIPNTFLIQPARNLEGWSAKSCNSTEQCSPVKMQYVGPVSPASVPNGMPAY
ncbi:hypothetical protein F7734_03140 [Scytonema sp. UIC 10036]|uniref:hypothetical protein n=1 Tax=Scytonema sp. UIC 10036 TaxID=2304196 RepID=UPI0012DA1738|nr:hypothetical protein [Scytonema sp. UIC 10036]MUG91536.1 hypothetical protein [Scytonema sp. UIC 10036]